MPICKTFYGKRHLPKGQEFFAVRADS